MSLKLVGAGVGRTGTFSLKVALEQLLGGTCYHMFEVRATPTHAQVWLDAMRGRPVEWADFLGGYEAIVDFPGAVVWRELSDAFPDAPVLLSTRESADAWWDSANATIVELTRRRVQDSPQAPDGDPQAEAITEMIIAMWERWSPGWSDPSQAKAAYEAHNEDVRAAIPPDRLFEYRPGDGWDPICKALGLDAPDAPFPQTNSRDEFRARAGLDQPDSSPA